MNTLQFNGLMKLAHLFAESSFSSLTHAQIFTYYWKEDDYAWIQLLNLILKLGDHQKVNDLHVFQDLVLHLCN